MFESQMCIVELFGHSQIAGKVTDVQIGGAAFLRVDVPEVDGVPGFTKFYGTGAIYAITPIDESTMLAAIRAYKVEPVAKWSIQRYLPAPADDDEQDPADEIDDSDDYVRHHDFAETEDRDDAGLEDRARALGVSPEWLSDAEGEDIIHMLAEARDEEPRAADCSDLPF